MTGKQKAFEPSGTTGPADAGSHAYALEAAATAYIVEFGQPMTPSANHFSAWLFKRARDLRAADAGSHEIAPAPLRLALDDLRALIKSECGHIAYLDDCLDAVETAALAAPAPLDAVGGAVVPPIAKAMEPVWVESSRGDEPNG